MNIRDAILILFFSQDGKKSLFVFIFNHHSFSHRQPQGTHFLCYSSYFFCSRYPEKKCFRGSFQKKNLNFIFFFFYISRFSYSSFLLCGMSFVISLLLDMMVYNFRFLTDWRIFFSFKFNSSRHHEMIFTKACGF